MEQLVESNRERERTEREAKHFKKAETETKRELHEMKVQFELYKRENEIKDLLEVKFDIDVIDEGLLKVKDTQIRKLEDAKKAMEK